MLTFFYFGGLSRLPKVALPTKTPRSARCIASNRRQVRARLRSPPSPEGKGRSTVKMLIPRRQIGFCAEKSPPPAGERQVAGQKADSPPADRLLHRKIASPRGAWPCRARKCLFPAGNRQSHSHIANWTAGERDSSRHLSLPPWGITFLRANRTPAGGETRFFAPDGDPPVGGRHFSRRGLLSPRGDALPRENAGPDDGNTAFTAAPSRTKRRGAPSTPCKQRRTCFASPLRRRRARASSGTRS